jgi:hypothetical protein
MRLLSLLTCLSLSVLAPVAYAQDPSGEDEDIDPVIDPVVVVPLGEAAAASRTRGPGRGAPPERPGW